MSKIRVLVAGTTVAGLLLAVAACSSKGDGQQAYHGPGPSAHLDWTTWLNSQEGWAAVSGACTTGSCEEALHTTDGGRSWTRFPLAVGTDGQLDRLLPVTASVLYRTDQSGGLDNSLSVSTDGGRTWAPEHTSGGTAGPVTTLSLAARGDTVVRAGYEQQDPDCPGTGNCGDEIQLTTPGSNTWHTVVAPLANGASQNAKVVWQNDHVVYAGFFGEPNDSATAAVYRDSLLFRSLDGGRHWTSMTDPCVADHGGTIKLATDTGDRLAAICEASPGPGAPAQVFLRLSTDDGTTWGPWRPTSTTSASAHDVALTGSKLVATTDQGVQTSADGGATWHDVESVQPGPDSGLLLSGFDGSDFGQVVDLRSNTMWTTTDGGSHWTPVTVSMS